MSLPSIAEVYARWHNPNCGFELEPDRNVGPPQTSENGILFHATFLKILEMRGTPSDFAENSFLEDVSNLETRTPGVFDRGVGDSDYVDYKIRNENSQDNYIGILSPLLNLPVRLISMHARWNIANHGIKNFFIYNNVKPRVSLPMNPGNWSVFLAFSQEYPKLEKLFMPFFWINYFLTNHVMSRWETLRGKPQSSSNKILYLLILHSLQANPNFKWLYNNYVRRMTKVFGENFVEELMKIYYNNPNHPNRLYSAGIILKEV